jgi:hypothetical protein
MKTVNTLLGSVALTLASSLAVEAGDLFAGPLQAGSQDTITCAALNTSPSSEDIFVTIYDNSFHAGAQLQCSTGPLQYCLVSDVSYRLAGGNPPFNCRIGCFSSGTDTPNTCAASICASQPGMSGSGSSCLPALPTKFGDP